MAASTAPASRRAPGGCRGSAATVITRSERGRGARRDSKNRTDEGLTPPAICLQGGECGTTTATCSGAGGWVCNYPGVTQFPETKCDGKDNDCDTRFDEGQPNLGDACDDGRVGVCKGT